MEIKRIGVLTSGGDCPGLNAVLRGLSRAAESRGWEVYGFLDGYEGLLSPGKFVMLDRARTAGIMHLGGTIIGTTNRGNFGARGPKGQKPSLNPEVLENARKCLASLGVDALVAVGGDGSLTTALQLHRAGIPIVGVPKTIDNDLEATQITFGFDSAIACVADSLDRLHTTASSHKRVMVMEVMGRNAGWIALYGGMAGGADIILIPEIPFDYTRIAEVIQTREREGTHSTMIVVAEGARACDGRRAMHTTSTGEYRLGGIGDQVARQVAQRTGKETRTCVLGHLQRGGAPSTLDRILGLRFGVHAVELLGEGKFGHMVSYMNHQVTDVPLHSAVHRSRRVSPSSQVVRMAKSVGISFGE